MTDTAENQLIDICEAAPTPHVAVEILMDGEPLLARMHTTQTEPYMHFIWFDDRGRRCTDWAASDGGRVTHWRAPKILRLAEDSA